MPRKHVPKNRYCKRSKLTEDEFKSLVFYYFSEIFFGYTRKDCYYLFRDADSPARLRNFSLSHQAFNSYFEKIGQYIWDNQIVGMHPSFSKDDVFDDLLGMIYGKIDQIVTYRELYNSLDGFPLYINEDTIAGSLMFYLLSNRSKTIRGFTKEKFYLEFSRVFFICSAIKKRRIELLSIYSVTDAKRRTTLCMKTAICFLCSLEKKPM